MRPIPFSLALTAFLLIACIAETPEPLPTRTPVPVSTQTPIFLNPIRPPQRAPMLRVALLADITTTNVWSLFDETGASYWNASTQSGYWPSLFYLAPPSLDLRPVTAQGDLPPVICDNLTCTATVSLRPGPVWTDGSAFTAADVVFTVNTALGFRLGLNWRQAYNPDVLDHAEALDEHTVRLYFKSHPSVADWQYGVLQGPVVNRAYWQPRIAEAVALLPDETMLAAIRDLEAEYAWMKGQLDEMKRLLSTDVPGSLAYAETTRQADRLQGDLVGVNNTLEKKRAEVDAKLAEARAVLITLTNENEPTLGPWKFSTRVSGGFENQVNLGTTLRDPWFDTVRYTVYPDESTAVDALLNNQEDLILTPHGLSFDSVSRLEADPNIVLSRNPTRSGRFLGFNHANPYLADPVLHRALACVLDPAVLMEHLGHEVVPLSGFVLDDPWHNETAVLPCAGTTGIARTVEAIRLLKEAGYSWEQEPASGANGQGLKAPDGSVLPGFRLLVSQQDPLRVIAAQSVALQADVLGFEVVVEMRSSDDFLYAVYGSGDFDLALMGWHLSAYPAYLCDWFTDSGQDPFGYNGSSHRSECEAWGQVNDFGLAQSYAFEVQSILAQDLPFIPLYETVRVDPYRNLRYPFTEVIDGLGGLYGAPSFAIPLP